MKKNNNGFTLIESIISFAIIALAGGMFLLGFYNVATIASEGSIIKTETNTLYSDVVAKEYSGEYLDAMGFIIDGETNPVVIKCATVSEEKKMGSGTNEYEIVLSKFVPSHSLNEWIEEEPPGEEKKNFDADFYLLKKIEYLPKTYEQIKTNQFGSVNIIQNALDSTVESRVNEKFIFGTDDVQKYLLKTPSKDGINVFKDNSLDPVYSAWLGDSYYIKWFCIDFQNKMIGTDNVPQYRVYGYLTKPYNRCVIIKLDNRIVILDIDENNKLILSSEDPEWSMLNGKKFEVNGKIYNNWGKFHNGEFINDDPNADVYIATIVD